MKYVQNKDKPIDLDEKNENGTLKHQEIINQNPNAKEIDVLMFNELMSMITGELAMTRYINHNVKQSGLEIWRKLHRSHDPNTHGTKETMKRKIEQLSMNRCKDTKELSVQFEKLQAAFDQYEVNHVE